MLRRLVVVFVLACALAPAAVDAEPPHTHEYLTNRPSGFWTSNRPAEGGAYRYRLMLIGVAIAAIMVVVVWRVAKHARRP